MFPPPSFVTPVGDCQVSSGFVDADVGDVDEDVKVRELLFYEPDEGGYFRRVAQVGGVADCAAQVDQGGL